MIIHWSQGDIACYQSESEGRSYVFQIDEVVSGMINVVKGSVRVYDRNACKFLPQGQAGYTEYLYEFVNDQHMSLIGLVEKPGWSKSHTNSKREDNLFDSYVKLRVV